MKPTLASRWITRRLTAGIIIRRAVNVNKMKTHSGVKIDLSLTKQLNSFINTMPFHVLLWRASTVNYSCEVACWVVCFADLFARRLFAITQPSTNKVIGIAASPKNANPPTTCLPSDVSVNACSGGVSANVRPIMLLNSGGERIILQTLLLNFATDSNILRWRRSHYCRMKRF